MRQTLTAMWKFIAGWRQQFKLLELATKLRQHIRGGMRFALTGMCIEGKQKQAWSVKGQTHTSIEQRRQHSSY